MSDSRTAADLLVAGGGASGLAAAVVGARLGLAVRVLERTDRCGRKLALTGGHKCNFTHADGPRAMAERFDCDRSVLVPLLRRFPYQRIVAFFEMLGVKSRSDEQGCIWPAGKDGADVRDYLLRAARRSGAEFLTGVRAKRAVQSGVGWCVESDHGEWTGRHLLLATGGASYPQTGSTGDGLRLCRDLGLAVTGWFPALCSLRPVQPVEHLAGNARQQVGIALEVDGTVVRQATGHFLFAHDYVTGSAILNLSGFASRALAEGRRVTLLVDWVPELDADRLRREFDDRRARGARRRVVNVLASRLSRRLAVDFVGRCGVPVERVLADLARAERDRVVEGLKATRLDIAGTEPMERATVTGGGVLLDEVDLLTGEVRRFPGLHVAGELLDAWAETGGYNLHFAWATGMAVAEAVAGKELK